MVPVGARWAPRPGLFLCSSLLFAQADVGEPREDEKSLGFGCVRKNIFAAEQDCLTFCHWAGSDQGPTPLTGSPVFWGFQPLNDSDGEILVENRRKLPWSVTVQRTKEGHGGEPDIHVSSRGDQNTPRRSELMTSVQSA